MRLLSHTILLSLSVHILFLMIITLLSHYYFTGSDSTIWQYNLSYDCSCRLFVSVVRVGCSCRCRSCRTIDWHPSQSLHREQSCHNWLVLSIRNINTCIYILFTIGSLCTCMDPHFNFVTLVTALLYCTILVLYSCNHLVSNSACAHVWPQTCAFRFSLVTP